MNPKEYGDKIGQCEICDKEETPVQYSYYSTAFLCESCWDTIAEIVISGE